MIKTRAGTWLFALTCQSQPPEAPRSGQSIKSHWGRGEEEPKSGRQKINSEKNQQQQQQQKGSNQLEPTEQQSREKQSHPQASHWTHAGCYQLSRSGLFLDMTPKDPRNSILKYLKYDLQSLGVMFGRVFCSSSFYFFNLSLSFRKQTRHF